MTDAQRVGKRRHRVPKANKQYYGATGDDGNFTLYIVTKARSLFGSVVKLNQNVMTQRHPHDLAGFRGKARVSLWQTAHISVLICFCDRCKYVEMLSQPQWLPSCLMGVTHRWPHNRDVIKRQSYPSRKLARLNVGGIEVVAATLLPCGLIWMRREMTKQRGTQKLKDECE